MEKNRNANWQKNAPVSKGWGTAGFIIGLSSIFLLCVSEPIPSVWRLIPGVLGLIFCIIQLKRGKTGFAICGLILNIIAILIGICPKCANYLE